MVEICPFQHASEDTSMICKDLRDWILFNLLPAITLAVLYVSALLHCSCMYAAAAYASVNFGVNSCQDSQVRFSCAYFIMQL